MSDSTQQLYYIATGQLTGKGVWVSSQPMTAARDAKSNLEFRFAVDPKTIEIHPIKITTSHEPKTI